MRDVASDRQGQDDRGEGSGPAGNDLENGEVERTFFDPAVMVGRRAAAVSGSRMPFFLCGGLFCTVSGSRMPFFLWGGVVPSLLAELFDNCLLYTSPSPRD